MHNTIVSISLLFTLLVSAGGCSFPGVYKIDVQQGNLITQDMVDQLRPGMTKSQVRYVMGSPLIIDTFQTNRWDYIFSMRPGGEERTQKRLSLFFVDDKLDYFTGDFQPSQPESTPAVPAVSSDTEAEKP